jgi:pentatricopeptide repeat protein
MSSFYIEFRDPLFSIIILLAIIFVVSFFSYWWGRYKIKEDHKYLDNFLKQFHTLPSQKEIVDLIKNGDLPQKSWLLLADTYRKNGDFEKAIDIYSELLKLDNEGKNTRDIMFLLGKTYFKAGFLGRARDVFLEILKKTPRTPQVLHYLLLTYEYMREYSMAKEVLEPLEELNEDILKESVYLRLLEIFQNQKNIDETIDEVIKIYQKYKILDRMVFEYLFMNNSKKAWEVLSLNIQKSKKIADILWMLEQKDIDINVIKKDNFLKELFSAKGYVDLASNSDIFELDILINVDKKVNASLNFEFICDKCKVAYPFGFNRCSNCHAIDTATIEYTLIRDYTRNADEEGYSFL